MPGVDGTKLRYRLGGCVGEGATGKVFVGLNVMTGDLLAVKQISFDNITREEVSPCVSSSSLPPSRPIHPFSCPPIAPSPLCDLHRFHLLFAYACVCIGRERESDMQRQRQRETGRD